MGASSSDLKKLEEAIKGLQTKLNTSESKSVELAKRVTRAESKAGDGWGVPPGGGKGKAWIILQRTARTRRTRRERSPRSST